MELSILFIVPATRVFETFLEYSAAAPFSNIRRRAALEYSSVDKYAGSRLAAFSLFSSYSVLVCAIVMSLLPFLLEDLSRPTAYDQHFGLGLLDDMLVPSEYIPHIRTDPLRLRGYQRPMRLVAAPKSGLSQIHNDKDGFKVNLDVQQFKPDEVTVKVVDDFIVVNGKHEERTDEHGFISREFTRRYKIPESVDQKLITSSLSSDGVLSIGAPKKVVNENKEEISIPIIKTNKPSIKVSANKEQKEGDKMDTN
ncbi:Alpha crystallin/Heat shock protein,HSP20-like chaperone,Alpha crystallin/Hsp20 domain [Cinara cedri]|uniref:Alpha crystallin/Heat shock protein,HSP20-like chaperone,Alpha crystallin/Hsp20 domain n=1 Tax=Cinara cedri TaxID=506608 RepID=A0A5E4MWD4_9HEMI|nr:Alpha crystallin/Heat shock protein,HSP20-like chaperone,Alpha crystallin/Hsp20 domain [Cinara cedri]